MIGLIKSILKKNKKVFYLYHYYKTSLQLIKCRELIIIHTPGHVASSSVYKSLKSYPFPGSSILFDIHSLHERYNNNSIYPSLSARHIVQDAIFNYLSRSNLSKKKIKLICLVRDPVARALSGFFHSFNLYVKNKSLKEISDFEQEYQNVHELICGREFSQSYIMATIRYQKDWFQKEVAPFFDISIEENLFEKTQDYCIYKNKNIELLVLKAERLNNGFNSAMSRLLNIKISLENSNTHSTRTGSNEAFYKYFKNKFKLPVHVIEEIYNDPFVSHFYSNEEIEAFRNTWEK